MYSLGAKGNRERRLMKKLKIAVFVREKEYGFDLAKGLCSQSSGIEVFVAEDQAEAFDYAGKEGVVITDRRVENTSRTLLLTGEREGNHRAGNLKSIYKISPAKEILKAAISVCLEATGEIFCPEQEAELRIWELFSPRGGSGTTAIALTCARLLASRPEEKVLYMNLGIEDDYGIYAETRFDNVRPKRKFIYAAEVNSRIGTDNCFAADGYGLCYFRPEAERNSFLYEADMGRVAEFLRKNREFTRLVIDSGKRSKSLLAEADLTFKISREGDLRRDRKDEKIREIINFSVASGLRDGRFYIPFDKESFARREEKTEISMEGMFAAAVFQIVSRCLQREDESPM